MDLFQWNEIRFHNVVSSLRLATSVVLLSPCLGFFCAKIAPAVSIISAAAKHRQAYGPKTTLGLANTLLALPQICDPRWRLGVAAKNKKRPTFDKCG